MVMLERSYRLEFVAHPVVGRESFEFVYGVEARKLMRQVREQVEDSPWIALYRRVARR
jgi:hypothetical protein